MLLKIKEADIVGFTKLTSNSKLWRNNTQEDLTSTFSINENRLATMTDINLFYPDNEEQNLIMYTPQEDKMKQEKAFIPPPSKGGKEVIILCYNNSTQTFR